MNRRAFFTSAIAFVAALFIRKPKTTLNAASRHELVATDWPLPKFLRDSFRPHPATPRTITIVRPDSTYEIVEVSQELQK